MADLVTRLRQYRGERFETTECYNGLRDEAAAEIEGLLAALRKLAIRQHVRLVYGGGMVPNGLSCELCKAESAFGAELVHASECILGSGSDTGGGDA